MDQHPHSSIKFIAKSKLLILLLGAILCFPCAVNAASVQGIRSTISNPIAVRGGVLLLPLTARTQGRNWPSTLKLFLSDGRKIDGQVIWIHSNTATAFHHWTIDPRGVAVRKITNSDDSSLPKTGAAFLAVRIPLDADGQLKLGGQELRPQWYDSPPLIASLGKIEPEAATLLLINAPDLPDARSPFEYFRWVLLAQRLGMHPPNPNGLGEIKAMVAQHYADLWQIAFTRLAFSSPGVAGACRDLLTQTCMDLDQAFGVWVNDPQELDALLSLLLNRNRSDRDVRNAALAWADSKDLSLMWPQGIVGDQVEVAFANPNFMTQVVRFYWLNSNSEVVAAELEPRVVTRVKVDRPVVKKTLRLPGALPSIITDPATSQEAILLIEMDNSSRKITSRAGVPVATPPGVYFATLRQPLTLSEARTQLRYVVPQNQKTTIQLRRLNNRWELLLECWREQESNNKVDISQASDPDDVRGSETLTIYIGPSQLDGGPSVILTVPEEGWHRLFAGSNDGTLQIHRRSYVDRWICRLVLPDAWMAVETPGRIKLGFVRTHNNTQMIELGPNTTVPWQLDPGRIEIDISHWNDLPIEPVSPRPIPMPIYSNPSSRGGG